MRPLSRIDIEDGLRTLTDRLVSSCHLTAVVMYKSRVWGKQGRESDIDLLVVRRTRKTWSYDRKKEVSETLGTLPIPRDLFDFVVVTSEELTRRLSMGDPFLGRIVRKGKVLYGQENLPKPEKVMTQPNDFRIAREWFDHAKTTFVPPTHSGGQGRIRKSSTNTFIKDLKEPSRDTLSTE